jgi:NAD+ kinase
MRQFRTVGIIGKQSGIPQVGSILRRLIDYLRQRSCQVIVDGDTALELGLKPEEGVPVTVLGARCDLVVVVGGDGTLLHAARALAGSRVPLVGINVGRLGFLVDCSPLALEPVLDAILEGEYETDNRTLLTAAVIGDPAEGRAYAALNDVVIHKWNTARMIQFEISIGGVFVSAQRADGLIISTPTGSTAYALSVGGPLVHPSLDAILLVPICPHDLSNRPLVVPGSSRIEVRVFDHDLGKAQMTCDGQTEVPLPGEALIRISRHADRACLLHPKGHDHYQILRAKLGWGGHGQIIHP